MSDLTVRPLQDAERGLLLALNNASVPHVNELDPARLDALLEQAEVALAALVDHHLAGALVALGPGADYPSANYRWFSERYEDFLYVDRVMVDPARRGGGVGRRLYAALADLARADCPCLLCEVNEEPPNPGSMSFHEKQGFEPVGRLDHPDSGKRVVLLRRNLREDSP